MVIHEAGNRKGTYTAEKLASKHFIVIFQSHDKYELPVKIASYTTGAAAAKRAEKEARA